MENWFKVLEFNIKAEDTTKWFFELLDDEKIPHKEEIKEKWIGYGKRAKYQLNVLVYVPKEYKTKVESYLKEYENPNNIIYEEAEELRNVNIDETEEFKLTKISQKVIKSLFLGMISIMVIGMIIYSIITK